MKDPFPLGRPNDSTEEAASLFVRYQREHPLTPDLARSFFLMCRDARAVMERVLEIRAL